MDKRRKYIAVVDTETLGVVSPLVYDLGVTITDKQGKIYAQANWLVKEVFENVSLMKTAYYADKVPKYLEMIARGEVEVKPWNVVRAEFIEMLDKYGVKVISAYNLGFDKRALAYTHKELGNEGKFLTRAFEMWDIWGMATQTILRHKTYHKVAKANSWFTPKGNLLTNAEVAFRYITNEFDFMESHTALHDTVIETQILVRCLRQHTKMKKGILGSPWRLAQAI